MTVSMVTGEAVHCRTVESLEEKERAAQMTEHFECCNAFIEHISLKMYVKGKRVHKYTLYY